MARLYPCILLVFCLFSLPLSSQIVINRNDMPGLGDTIRITNTTANSINLSQTGADYTWDFSSLSSGTSELLDYKNILQTPYFIFFPSLLTFGIKVPDISFGPFGFTDIYNFFLIDNNQYAASGIGIKFQGAPFAASYTKNDRIYNFPLRYNDVDSNNFSFTIDLPGIGKYKSSGYRKTVVDGWGQVTTPYGTFNCLRLYARKNAVDSIFVNVFGVNFNFGIPNDSWEYQWLAKGLKAPALSIEGRYVSSNFVITKAYYRGKQNVLSALTPPGISAASWNAFPNPGINGWSLVKDASWEGGKLSIFNYLGGLVRSMNISVGQTFMDMREQAAGLYIITLEKEGRKESMTLVLGK